MVSTCSYLLHTTLKSLTLKSQSGIIHTETLGSRCLPPTACCPATPAAAAVVALLYASPLPPSAGAHSASISSKVLPCKAGEGEKEQL